MALTGSPMSGHCTVLHTSGTGISHVVVGMIPPRASSLDDREKKRHEKVAVRAVLFYGGDNDEARGGVCDVRIHLQRALVAPVEHALCHGRVALDARARRVQLVLGDAKRAQAIQRLEPVTTTK